MSRAEQRFYYLLAPLRRDLTDEYARELAGMMEDAVELDVLVHFAFSAEIGNSQRLPLRHVNFITY